MTQAKYNAKVQEIQKMWGDAASFRIHHDNHGNVSEAFFQVYWDGRNRVLGQQRNPFQHNTSYEWNEGAELELRGSFADALIHS